MSWQLYPSFAVRAAGFPVELLEDLTTAELTAAVTRYGDAAEAAEALRSRLLSEELPASVTAAHGDHDSLRALSRIRERVGRRRTGAGAGLAGDGELPRLLREWNIRQDACAALLDRVTAVAGASQERTAERLALLAARQDVQGALMLLSPSFFTAVQRHAARPARPAGQSWAFYRRLALYLQRLAARNETHSYFGPIGYGHVDPAADGIAVDGYAGAGSPGVFATYRLAAGLAEAIENSGAVPPRPRRVPTARRAGSRLVTLRGQFPLGHLGCRLWDLADGSRTSAELTNGTGDPLAAAAVLSRLQAAGALVHAPMVDPRSEDPLADLELRLAGTQAGTGRWPEVIAEFRRLLRRFATAPVPDRLQLLGQIEERYRALTGAEPRVGAGRMYADRTLLFEERPSTCSVRLGTELAETIRAGAGAALSLWAAASAQRHAVLRRHAAAVFASAFGEAGEVPFLEVLRTLRRHPATGPVSTSVHRWMDERISHCAGPCLDLDAGAGGSVAGTAAPHLFASIDLLLARTGPAPDDVMVVIGEAHPMNLLSVFPTDYYARREMPQRCADRDAWLLGQITPPGTRLAQIVGGRSAKIFAYPQAVVPVELRPRLPTAAATPVADLVVRRAGERLALCDGLGELVLLPALTGGDETDPLTVFSLPAVGTTVFGTGPRLPRITVGGVVVQRRRWEVRLPDLPSRLTRAERYGAVIRWWAEQGMPRRVFVRAGAEPKPVYIDAASPVLAGCLMSLGTGQALTVTEMLPDVSQCWLAGPEGHHTCEFRFLAACHG
ncbi:MAG TPA: hypothetical protein VN969_46450 [Streptosporangiaceae bacterium]|nr:hypothetical protein [Streptosporangiaceae bacterium]